MICRNCSAEIDERNEKCPHCHKDPKKRDSHSKGGLVALLLIVLAVVAAVFIGLNFNTVKEKVFSVLPESVVSALSKESKKETSKAETTSKKESEKKTTAEAKATTKSASESKKETTSQKETTSKKQSNEKTTKAESKVFDLSAAQIKEIPVLSSDKKEISKRGLITAEKTQLKALSREKFSEFCLQKISRSPYSWVTIEFSDSTGIVFTGNCATSAVYCRLDENDYIGEVLGTIILSSDGNYVFTEKGSSPAPSEPVTTSAASKAETSSNEKSTEKKTTEKKTTEKKTTQKKAAEKTTSADYTLNKNALKDKTTTKAKAETTAAKETTKKAEKSSVVYITDSGKKYHAAGCPSLSKSKHEISLKDAKSKGYTACKRCNP